jgi:hypothetical protein
VGLLDAIGRLLAAQKFATVFFMVLRLICFSRSYLSKNMDDLASYSRGWFDTIIPLYRDTDFAFLLATLMAFAAFLVILFAVIAHLLLRKTLVRHANFIRQRRRYEGVPVVRETATVAEIQFYNEFENIDEELGDRRPMSIHVARAWLRFRDTLILTPTAPLKSARSPRDFYFGSIQPSTGLEFAAGMFVAFGLLATFLGLVAALSFAAEGLQSTDTAAMQAALRDLLSAASSKFVTSVAGVALSMLVRFFDHWLSSDLKARIEDLCVAIETGIRVDPDGTTALAEELRLLSDKLLAGGVNLASEPPLVEVKRT